MKTKIHLLGASGFIGNSLYKKFSSENEFEVKGYSSTDCNLLFPNSIFLTFPKFTKEDVVIMASSITRLKENSLESMTKNIHMASNMSKFIRSNPPGYFIFLSTTDVYGINPELPITEKNLPSPNDYYAISKLSSEFILKSVCLDDIPLLILRLSGVYGKGDDGRSTVNRLVKSAKEGKITLINGGIDKRDFVYVDDLHSIIKEGIDKKTNLTINVATGKNYSIEELAEFVISSFSEKILIEYKKEKDDKRRVGEMRFDLDLLNKTFPKIRLTDIRQGLDLYLKEYLN